MLTLEKAPLFEDINAAESAIVSGGRSGSYMRSSYMGHGGHGGPTSPYRNDLHFDLDKYLFVLGAGVTFGNPGLTPDEVQAGWLAGLSL
ncbi:MAG: hypothetical protein MUC48_22605 [Leptolyngbya sp. Prado105]|jgi:hypothetical protein|nr:hypothetical protein [Leptolyngbya sp. Prado105]